MFLLESVFEKNLLFYILEEKLINTFYGVIFAVDYMLFNT